MLLDNQTTTIVIVVGVILLAIVAVLIGKNVELSMFGSKFRTKGPDPGPVKTEVANGLVVSEKATVEEILGTEGAAVDGDVDVARDARIEGKVKKIAGRIVETKPKDDNDA